MSRGTLIDDVPMCLGKIIDFFLLFPLLFLSECSIVWTATQFKLSIVQDLREFQVYERFKIIGRFEVSERSKMFKKSKVVERLKVFERYLRD